MYAWIIVMKLFSSLLHVNLIKNQNQKFVTPKLFQLYDPAKSVDLYIYIIQSSHYRKTTVYFNI